MKNLNLENLNEEDKQLLASIINHVDIEEHPCATLANLKYFRATFAKRCITKALPRLNEEYREVATVMLRVI